MQYSLASLLAVVTGLAIGTWVGKHVYNVLRECPLRNSPEWWAAGFFCFIGLAIVIGIILKERR